MFIYFNTMSKKRYSFIWLYFDEKENKKAKCKFCKAMLSFTGGSQSNLARHLKLKHSLTFSKHTKARKRIKVEPNLDESSSSSTQVTTVTQQHQVSETVEENGLSKGTDVHKLDQLVLKMIAKGYHSLRFVEEPHFKNFVSELSNNCYTLPSRKTLTYDLLPLIYMELLEDVRLKIESATDVSLTIDTWTSRMNISYVSATAHYVNADTDLTSHLLACRDFDVTDAPQSLYNFLKTVISDFKLSNKIAVIVSNHSPDILGAIHQGEWLEIGCFAYSLDLLVQAATSEIVETINKVRNIVEYIRINLHGSNETQIGQKLSELKLNRDDPLRWNSTYEMLQRTKDLQDTIISILSLKNPNLLLTIEEWEIIGETIYVLSPFYEVIMEISGEKYVLLSKVTVLCNLLENFIHKCFPFNEKVITMVGNLQRDFDSCFGNLEKEYIYAESTILDPRFKRRGFKDYVAYEQALNNLRSKINYMKLPNIVDETAATLSPAVGERNSIWQAYDLEFFKTAGRDNNDTSICELDNYLAEEYLDRKSDALSWWKARKNIYPKLYLYALKRLCIVATSVPSERIFSLNCQSMSDRRAILEPNEVERLVFLHNNM